MDPLNQLVKSTFKLHGFNLNVETTKCVIEVLNDIPGEKHDDFLEKVLDELTRKNLESGSCLTKTTLQDVFKEVNFNQKEEKIELLHVVDAFDVPKSIYCDQTKKLVKIANSSKTYQHMNSRSVISKANSKIELFVQRFKIMHQRTLRHELFSPCVVTDKSNTAKKKFQLKPIEFLLSNTSHSEETIVLGMISQLRENKFYLEDLTGSLPLNLSETKYHNGIYTEGCFVLAEGILEDGVFNVKALGFPPAEVESTTRAYFGNVNYFGGPGEISCKSSIALSQAQFAVDTMIVFLADVWLDSEKVIEKLQALFIGYSDCPPYAFVICGNFLSQPKYGLRTEELSEGFKRLANLILQFNTIKEKCHFIFIPGPQDPGVVKVYPRPGMLNDYTEYIRKKIPNCHFPSNPCRIQFGSRQIVVFREDLLQKMSRNAIKIPDSEKLSEDLAKTLICQAHLSPLPLHVVPIYWNYDHVMRLYPLPDLVVVADKQRAYTHTHSDCTIMSPGSFSFDNFSFKVYVPSTKQIEDCLIPND